MRKALIVMAILFLAAVMAGCCNNPGALQQVQQAYNQAQAAAYGPDGQLLPHINAALNDSNVKEGISAADMALTIGGILRDSYCTGQQQADTAAAKAAEAVAKLNPTAAK